MLATPEEMPVLVAAGMDFEASLARGPSTAVVFGQNRRKFREDLQDHARRGVRGIISFGIAGGVCPDFKPGDVIVASAVITAAGIFHTSPDWSNSLLQSLPGARHMPVFGAEGPVLGALEKEALWRNTGAVAVDMESGPAAEIAARYGLPYAILRVVLDPAHRTVPLSALAASRDDGKTDGMAVVRSLMRRPGDLPALMRLAVETRTATRSLARSTRAAGPQLGFVKAAAAEKFALNAK